MNGIPTLEISYQTDLLRRVTLIESVAKERLGEDVARLFFSLVADIDAAMRYENLPLPPKPTETDTGLLLEFDIGSNFELITIPVLPQNAATNLWPRCHRTRFANITKNGEVII